jgi:hypothetical protein
MENKELEKKMANMYLDGYGPDGPPTHGDGAGGAGSGVVG